MTKEIPLTRGKVALVDDEDYSLLNQFKWSAARRRTWYAVRSVNERIILMHRIILDTPDGFECDHINGNGLDNRRCNLRIVTTAQNQMNRNKTIQCSSQFKGVCWDKSRDKWTVYIMYNQKQIPLGRYLDEVEAARAYDEAAKRLFGEYAKLNF